MQTRLRAPSHPPRLDLQMGSTGPLTPGFTPQCHLKAGSQATHIKGAPRLPEQTLGLSLLLKWPPATGPVGEASPSPDSHFPQLTPPWSLARSTPLKQNTDISPPLGRK